MKARIIKTKEGKYRPQIYDRQRGWIDYLKHDTMVVEESDNMEELVVMLSSLINEEKEKNNVVWEDGNLD